MITASAVRRRLSEEADPQALVEQNLPLVRKLAWHVSARASNAIELEDLMQIGLVALVEASRVYEDQGFAFSTYASTRIKGAMLDALRRTARQPRSVAATRRELDAARREVEGRTGSAASAEEIAEQLGITLAELRVREDAAMPVAEVGLADVYADDNVPSPTIAKMSKPCSTTSAPATCSAPRSARWGSASRWCCNSISARN